jgi:hypothetical protein
MPERGSGNKGGLLNDIFARSYLLSARQSMTSDINIENTGFEETS